MSIIRTTAIICLTFLISAALFIYYGSIENRYKLVKADNGLYIFDSTSTVTNYCDKFSCRGLSAGIIMPRRYDMRGHGQYPYIGQIPEVPIMPYNQFNPDYGNMTYLPVQSNQAYILQPVPQPTQPKPAITSPTPKPQAPVPVAPQIVPPAPVLPNPAPAEFDEDMGFALPETTPTPAIDLGTPSPAQEGTDLGTLPEGGLPTDENAGGFEEAPTS